MLVLRCWCAMLVHAMAMAGGGTRSVQREARGGFRCVPAEELGECSRESFVGAGGVQGQGHGLWRGRVMTGAGARVGAGWWQKRGREWWRGGAEVEIGRG